MEIELKGFEELGKALQVLPRVMRDRLVKRVMRKVGRIVQEKAQVNAPVDTGNLRDHITFSIQQKRAWIIARVRTGTRAAMGVAADDPWYYPAIQEYGAESVGVPEVAYMRRSLDQTRERVVATMKGSIGRDLVRTMRRLVRQTGSTQVLAGAQMVEGMVRASEINEL